jgi:hypothetical protein
MTEHTLTSAYSQTLLDLAEESRSRMPVHGAIFLHNNRLSRTRSKIDDALNHWSAMYTQADQSTRAQYIDSLCELTSHNAYACGKAQPIFDDLISRQHVSALDIAEKRRAPPTTIQHGHLVIINPNGLE